MSRSLYVTLGVIAERERQKAPLREVGIPLYLPLPEAPLARDIAEADDGEAPDVFVVWGDDDED